MKELTPEEIFRVLQTGVFWDAKKIKEAIEEFAKIKKTYIFSSYEFNYDSEEKCHYLYDNECYLFVFDEQIQLRCDRLNVFSSDLDIKIPIHGFKDIQSAYEKFISMTLEAEDDDEE